MCVLHNKIYYVTKCDLCVYYVTNILRYKMWIMCVLHNEIYYVTKCDLCVYHVTNILRYKMGFMCVLRNKYITLQNMIYMRIT